MSEARVGVPTYHGRTVDWQDLIWSELKLRPTFSETKPWHPWSPLLTRENWARRETLTTFYALRGHPNLQDIVARLEKDGFLIERAIARVDSSLTRDEQVDVFHGFFGFAAGMLAETIQLVTVEFKREA